MTHTFEIGKSYKSRFANCADTTITFSILKRSEKFIIVYNHDYKTISRHKIYIYDGSESINLNTVIFRAQSDLIN